ncbi:unnamed protein product [Phytophthora fragariaefolia]|uniref:Unnamed protein product n=1 Tax=Phytophthora fragariaefolia TaxID=1490495 RepID=A0A9W6UFQ0_9STRA|nr:unnamed protein product [Phytophthora fragariaefolia]
MPLSEVENPLTRNMSKLKPICSKTLKVFMGKVVAAVEAKISSEMTGLFGIMFDGWTCFLEHYVALFAVFWHEGDLKQMLLAIAPMEERDLTAQSHCAFMQKIFEIFHQSESSLAF